MKITYMNGNRLRLAFLAGARRLAEHTQFLNRINVFPVADGDTGTNMTGTVQAVVAALAAAPGLSLSATAHAAADSALLGAKGNSGAILAQFFQGLAEELDREVRISTRAFADAVGKAVVKTYDALSKPVEGTLLTVLKDWGHALHRAALRTDDFLELLRTTLHDARASLDRTRDMLPELRKAGVVDAGAQGWVHILEGIIQFVTHGKLREFRDNPLLAETEMPVDAHMVTVSNTAEPSAHRYCTECLLTGETLDLGAVRGILANLGDSVVVAGSARQAKVHI
ncbi:MAG TPA: DAK2 domain-containing protein, partial [Magnetospirillaceae bacterium]|nr:DAK2 domain-containing protein [Magnetospirillaceae bacterium]